MTSREAVAKCLSEEERDRVSRQTMQTQTLRAASRKGDRDRCYVSLPSRLR